LNLSGWGGYPRFNCRISYPKNQKELTSLVKSGSSIANGNQRSYGDSALSLSNTISMKYFNHMVKFNENNGQLVVESGVLLSDVIASFISSGWFPPVTPGTKFVTIGGMIAADVHGKNHHKHGSFRRFVDWIDLMDSNGEILRCSSQTNSELFNWTIGGMGLTGIIFRVAFRLKPVETGWINQIQIPTKNLRETFDVIEKSINSTYSVAWIDCMSKRKRLGRSIVYLGEHSKITDLSVDKKKLPFKIRKKKKLSMTFHLPKIMFNNLTLRLFNEVYYNLVKLRLRKSVISWDSFFYPLDSILHWNRIYGKRGFAQFQCVLPLSSSLEGIEAMLKIISDSGCGSFLAVLKRFGKQEGEFSFPMEGYTLSLDFPISKKTLELMTSLDKITLKFGGRFYLAKDSRMSQKVFFESDKRIKDFITLRNSSNLKKAFSSVQSNRLGL
jgi:FAD/FMN-containing dehydrogenase